MKDRELLRVDTNFKQRKTHAVVVVSVSSGGGQGISREIRVNSEAEFKQVQDYFGKELELKLNRIVHDFADGRESGI